MKILVSNDDGYLAPGIICLADALQKFADITVIAPDRNRSGASNSLTLDHTLRVNEASNGFLYVNGTPTDCVHLAMTGLLEELPDIVISGINAGANLGDDVLYSGTVAAAMEGRFLGLPALAISLTNFTPKYYVTAAKVAENILERLQTKSLFLPNNTILNVNVPDLPWKEIAGIQITRLGSRHCAEDAIKTHDQFGAPVYWIGPAGSERDSGPGTDFYAVNQDFVSITPLSVDLTNHTVIDSLKEWLQL
ncbi:MAG TPA: 5'/3'-nucleotidase SurE [Thioploca sp.]|nr:5'/3'-nucleotidase SurE [Thioploca sp.]